MGEEQGLKTAFSSWQQKLKYKHSHKALPAFVATASNYDRQIFLDSTTSGNFEALVSWVMPPGKVLEPNSVDLREISFLIVKTPS